MGVKKMVFAGSWYPGSADKCRSAIKTFCDDSKAEEDSKIPDNPVAGIVPHAGWTYSGKLACRVFSILARGSRVVDTIVLFGGHMHAHSPAYVLDCTAVETPLGTIEIDKTLTDNLVSRAVTAGVDLRQLTATGFPKENTLELQYPFIKYFFPQARIVVCAVPPSDTAPEQPAPLPLGQKKWAQSKESALNTPQVLIRYRPPLILWDIPA